MIDAGKINLLDYMTKQLDEKISKGFKLKTHKLDAKRKTKQSRIAALRNLTQEFCDISQRESIINSVSK